MLKSPTKIFISFSLSVFLLFGQCVSGYAHKHIPEETEQRLDDQAQHTTQHHHGHNHNSSRHTHHHHGDLDDSKDEPRLQESFFHAHFVLLFFELTIPLNSDNDFDPTEENDRGIYLVRLIAPVMPAVDRDESNLPSENSSESLAIFFDPTEKEVRTSARPQIKNLLCDAARHRRSGVQLF